MPVVRLAPTGAILGSSSMASDGSRPNLAWAGGFAGLVYGANRSDALRTDAYFQRVGDTGAPAGTSVRLTTAAVGEDAALPAIAWLGDSFGVVTEFGRSDRIEYPSRWVCR